jgi:hypothetical protein
MRDRATELLPLLLAGLVLLGFQLSRDGSLALPSSLFPYPTPTPVVEVAAASHAQPRRPAPEANAVLACHAAEPRFVGGLAALKATLGAAMGDPVECERTANDQGDTHQKTTTGLAYYRRHLNVASFTSGWDHWAMTHRGLVHWAGHEVDPPTNASIL